MRGPIEYIVDRWQEQSDGLTVQQELAEGDLRVATQYRNMGRLFTAMGGAIAGVGTRMLADGSPLQVEIDGPLNRTVRSAVETGLETIASVPVICIAAGGATLAVEGISFWRRGSRRRKQILSADTVE